MKRKLVIVAVTLAVILLSTVLTLPLWVDGAVRTAIESGGSSALGVETKVTALDIGILRSDSTIDGLTIANAPGFSQPLLLKIEKATIGVGARQLTGDHIRIPLIHIDGLELSLERKLGGSNTDAITANMKKGSGKKDGGKKDGGKTEKVESKGEKEGSKVSVAELKITNIAVNAKVMGVGTTLRLNELVLKNLGGDNGSSGSQLFAQFMTALLGEVCHRGQGVLPSELLNPLGKGLAGVGNGGLRLLGAGARGTLSGLRGTVGAGGKVLDAAGKGLKSLLPGRKKKDPPDPGPGPPGPPPGPPGR